jgi:hypothetical protein
MNISSNFRIEEKTKQQSRMKEVTCAETLKGLQDVKTEKTELFVRIEVRTSNSTNCISTFKVMRSKISKRKEGKGN